MHYTLREYGKIYPKEDFPEAKNTPDKIYLPASDFAALQRIVDEKSGESIFRIKRQNRKIHLQCSSYVGIVELNQGTVLEILPKIYLRKKVNIEADQELVQTRRALLQMLRTLKNTPFRQLGEAYLQAGKLPILEVFITAFTESVLILLERGLGQDYVLREANEPFLRGKLLFHEQVKNNLTKPHQFYTENDDFQKDIAANRLLKTAIDFLLKRTSSYANRARLQHFQSIFSSIPLSLNLTKDYQEADLEHRLYPHYQSPLIWAKIFLKSETFTPVRGSKQGLSLLFYTPSIFEEYVGQQFVQHADDYAINLRDRSRFLLHTATGSEKFTLLPDIIAENTEYILIMDAKWKIIDPTMPNYGIEQSDLYQMFSYGEKYANTNKKVVLFLIYPRNASFSGDLPAFSFHESRLPLLVISYDLFLSGYENVKRIIAKVSSK